MLLEEVCESRERPLWRWQWRGRRQQQPSVFEMSLNRICAVRTKTFRMRGRVSFAPHVHLIIIFIACCVDLQH